MPISIPPTAQHGGLDSTSIPIKLQDLFSQLVKDLSLSLNQSKSETFSGIDPEPIIRAMEKYTSKHDEWAKYAHGDEKHCFTRNLVDRGNDKYNLLILVWSPGKESPIHDHAGSHCVMKILQGSLKETQYKWPDHKAVDGGPSLNFPLQCQKDTTLIQDEVAYISDDHGLHKISNADPAEFAVSLHLYAPPNAAKHGCQVFDEKTGKAARVVQYSFFSEYGVKINE